MDKETVAERILRLEEQVELPDSITLKIRTKGLDRDLLNVLRCLMVTDKEKLPFDLARYIPWPHQQRALAARAQIFLRNGFLDLIEKSIDDENTDDRKNSVEKRPKVTAKNDIGEDGFSTKPKVQL